MYTEFI